MQERKLTNRILERLRGPLPGLAAQAKLAPRGRPLEPDGARYHDAAVLIVLHRRGGRLGFPLILRAEDEYLHSGQVSLPGGRRREDEPLPWCALRETYEEIGLPPQQVRLLGALTPLPVPVSLHLIHPFVAEADDDLLLTPDPGEVQRILFFPLDELLSDVGICEGEVSVRGLMLRVPYFALQEYRIWGATAMILSELREILKQS